jgi:hypothetical protein
MGTGAYLGDFEEKGEGERERDGTIDGLMDRASIYTLLVLSFPTHPLLLECAFENIMVISYAVPRYSIPPLSSSCCRPHLAFQDTLPEEKSLS